MKKLVIVFIFVLVTFLVTLACGKEGPAPRPEGGGFGMRPGFGGFRGRMPEMTAEMKEKFEARREEMRKKSSVEKPKAPEKGDKVKGEERKKGIGRMTSHRNQRPSYRSRGQGRGFQYCQGHERGFYNPRSQSARRSCPMLRGFYGRRGPSPMMRGRGMGPQRGFQRGPHRGPERGFQRGPQGRPERKLQNHR